MYKFTENIESKGQIVNNAAYSTFSIVEIALSIDLFVFLNNEKLKCWYKVTSNWSLSWVNAPLILICQELLNLKRTKINKYRNHR